MATLTPAFGSIIPSQVQQLLNTNYLQFNTGSGGDFAQQYLPEIYEAEVERYGNRTLAGFLRMVGAEMPMSSDQVIWSEQNRLHIAYVGCTQANGGTGVNPSTITLSATGSPTNVISINDTVVILDPINGLEAKGIVTASTVGVGTAGSFSVQLYKGTSLTTQGFGASGLKVFVYGSDYIKGTNLTGTGNNAARNSVNPVLTQYSNSPVIIRNQYVINGSDMAQIGWVEVATEDGTGGFLWFLKAESETRLRFEDYLEMSMVEGELNAVTTGTAGYANSQLPGTQGLFAAIKARGNVEVGFTAAGGLSAFDQILKNLDTQGAIEENMLFLQRQTALDFDDMLAALSSGAAG